MIACFFDNFFETLRTADPQWSRLLAPHEFATVHGSSICFQLGPDASRRPICWPLLLSCFADRHFFESCGPEPRPPPLPKLVILHATLALFPLHRITLPERSSSKKSMPDRPWPAASLLRHLARLGLIPPQGEAPREEDEVLHVVGEERRAKLLEYLLIALKNGASASWRALARLDMAWHRSAWLDTAWHDLARLGTA